jgi:glucose 1-dehydrogenase
MSTSTQPTPRALGMRGLEGKNVLVTGGTSGIGQAIAVRFAEHGANVAINYLRDPDEAADTERAGARLHAPVQQHGVRDVLVGADVSKEDEVERMVQETVDELGGLDVLINNAGIQISRPRRSCPAPTSTRCSRSTCAARSCARARRSSASSAGRGGSIINVSSVHQLIPKPDYLGYSVLEGRDDEPDPHAGPRVRRARDPRQRHRPGATITPINSAWIDDPVKKEQVESHIPMRRAGTADEMGGVACFLASDDARTSPGRRSSSTAGLTLYPSFREPWSSE